MTEGVEVEVEVWGGGRSIKKSCVISGNTGQDGDYCVYEIAGLGFGGILDSFRRLESRWPLGVEVALAFYPRPQANIPFRVSATR